jgi:hypothetical protein
MILTTLLLGACKGSNRVDNPPVVPTINSTPPTVVFEAVSQPQAVVIIEGRTTDAEQPLATLLVRIESDQSGLLWSGNPRSDGLFSWSQPQDDGTYRLLSGLHQITISVEDSTEQQVQLTKSLQVTKINNSIIDDTGADTADSGSNSDTDDTAN